MELLPLHVREILQFLPITQEVDDSCEPF